MNNAQKRTPWHPHVHYHHTEHMISSTRAAEMKYSNFHLRLAVVNDHAVEREHTVQIRSNAVTKQPVTFEQLDHAQCRK